jgi:methylated-DNA-protein-cysteine methyltransferase-like protein
MTGFFQRVYTLTSKIPKGKVSTYGSIAKAIGSRDARRVGHALHANKNKDVPCYRVVFKNGSLAPGYAFGGPDAQKKKLIAEGVDFTPEGKVDLSQFFFQFEDF